MRLLTGTFMHLSASPSGRFDIASGQRAERTDRVDAMRAMSVDGCARWCSSGWPSQPSWWVDVGLGYFVDCVSESLCVRRIGIVLPFQGSVGEV